MSSQPRLRVVSWRVQPIVMSDDGEHLTPVPVQPLDIPSADWEAFKAGGDAEALLSIQQQLDNPA